MDWYPWLVLLHVLGGFGFALGHGVSAHVAIRLRSERDHGRIAALLDLSGFSLTVVYLSLLVLLASGIAAGFVGGHWGRLWIWVALVLLIGIAAFMYAVGTTYYGGLRTAVGQKAYRDPKDAPPPVPMPAGELAALLESWRPYWLAIVGGIGLTLIIGLMVLKSF